MYSYIDEIYYKIETKTKECSVCRGDVSKCGAGLCNGMFSYSWVRRTDEEIKQILKENQRKYDDNILAHARRIRAARRKKCGK